MKLKILVVLLFILGVWTGLLLSGTVFAKDLLNTVNDDVNRKIERRVDTFDDWNIWPVFGDCEDYALTKMKVLLDKGVPRERMQLYNVQLQNSERHMILVVDNMVLDVPGLAGRVYPEDQVRRGYSDWRKAESARVDEALRTGSSPEYSSKEEMRKRFLNRIAGTDE